MSKKKSALAGLALAVTMSITTACGAVTYSAEDIKSAFDGRDAVIQSYNHNGQIIDRIEGKSIDVRSDTSFDQSDSEGKTISKSSVLSVIVGGKTVTHVGSTLIMRDAGLEDVFREYAQTVDISNSDGSTPIINRMMNTFKNATTGQNMLLLIRSQTGMPIASFQGEDVSFFATPIKNTTAFLIDGKILMVYRADYSLYDKSLLSKD